MAIYHKCVPRSEEWRAMRLGKPGTSEFHRIVTPTGKISSQAKEYAVRLVAELMLGRSIGDDIQTQYMVRGIETEDNAIEAFEFQTGLDTQPGGYVTTDDGLIGCSPDRLVGDFGILEIKVPAANTHVGYLLDPESMERDKYPQIMGQMLVCERDYDYLVSYHDLLPIAIRKVGRDEKYIDTLRTALYTFVQQVALMREKLEHEYGKFPEIVIPQPLADDDPGALGVSQDEVKEMIARGLLEDVR